MVVVQGLLALGGVICMGVSAWKARSLWQLGLTLVVLAVTLMLIKTGVAGL